jgi:hypothetical protein
MENNKNSLLELVSKFTGLLSNSSQKEEKPKDTTPKTQPQKKLSQSTINFLSKHDELANKIKNNK